ncbi:AAA-associated domain-containing protein [Vulcanisaeta souniana]|uniref:ABC transporter ATP-binding protein n=2 Tax=Vulcanisaeta souniana TaxID=164452 RepID=A0A830EHK0_9CREN|nr:AAA-associated domain-containing protein [Vulcanisaeta souniana]BDR93009.1 ABC transporter ATP-binding protein [Vulcanisaeta souniana JCM 11219]GGI83591.1 ABC transporter ATP-binding protein [Vulcanisaeta souniana JCM 11219]
MPDLPFMPLDARFADVLGLIDTLANEFKGQADIFMIAKEMESDIDDLMPALNAAVYLGFVEVKGGDIRITDAGREFLNAKISDRKKILKQKLINLEPFHTAYALGLHRPFTVDNLIEKLNEKGYIETREPGIRHLLEILLAEWGVFAGMLKKRGDEYIALP